MFDVDVDVDVDVDIDVDAAVSMDGGDYAEVNFNYVALGAL